MCLVFTFIWECPVTPLYICQSVLMHFLFLNNLKAKNNKEGVRANFWVQHNCWHWPLWAAGPPYWQLSLVPSQSAMMLTFLLCNSERLSSESGDVQDVSSTLSYTETHFQVAYTSSCTSCDMTKLTRHTNTQIIHAVPQGRKLAKILTWILQCILHWKEPVRIGHRLQ